MRPPALDLANRDLVEAHLHAVWLAESARELADRYPARPRSHDAGSAGAEGHRGRICRSEARRPRSAQSMRRILDSIECRAHAGRPRPGPRIGEAFADAIAASAAQRFSEAFDRWRQLYDGARAQLKEANRRSEMHGLSATERKEAKIQQAQANEQIALLERGTATGGSDFSTYRYLATEGFLPGYNFPRLPLYAYVPAIARRRVESRLSPARSLHRHCRVRAAQPDLSRRPRLSRLQGQAAARMSGPRTAGRLATDTLLHLRRMRRRAPA